MRRQELYAGDLDAALIHEAAIGKIAGASLKTASAGTYGGRGGEDDRRLFEGINKEKGK